ncbi:MAG: hypothetical protein SGI86_07250, partial [Deltaproteobacteria bacterium]|nr:hypothetical protein [Deltaproteobacteria bacterium]
MKRRGFLKSSWGVAVAVPVFVLGACGEDEGEGGSGGSGGGICSSTSANISNPHGHELVIPIADVLAGESKTYSIQGSSLHDHTVTIGAGNMVKLRDEKSLTTTSSAGGGHTHSIT